MPSRILPFDYRGWDGHPAAKIHNRKDMGEGQTFLLQFLPEFGAGSFVTI